MSSPLARGCGAVAATLVQRSLGQPLGQPVVQQVVQPVVQRSLGPAGGEWFSAL